MLDILEETCMLGSKPVETVMDPNVKLYVNQGELLSNLERYCCLVGKLNYLIITRPDISFCSDCCDLIYGSYPELVKMCPSMRGSVKSNIYVRGKLVKNYLKSLYK